MKRPLNFVLLALVVALASACGSANSSADNPSQDQNTRNICGVIDSIARAPSPLVGSPVFTIYFSDKRWFKVEGVPEITLTNGKMYTFTVSKEPGYAQVYTLVGTSAANSCGYEHSPPDTAKAQHRSR